MSGKAYEPFELVFVRDADETYHTPRESRGESVYTLDTNLQGSADSYRASPDLRQAEGHWSLADVDGHADSAPPKSSMTRIEQLASPAADSIPEDPYQMDDRSTETQANLTNGPSGSSFGDLSRYFSNHEKIILDLQSANATLTERVGQLEFSRNSWQEIQSRLLALEPMSAPNQQDTQRGPSSAAMEALKSRVSKLEKVNAGQGDSGVKEQIRRLEGLMEGERRERRTQLDKLQKNIKRVANDVAVVQSENEGLRERLNKLTGQVRNLTDESGLLPLEDVLPS